jgi:mono/diheme cytochrome c family protein
LSLRSPAFRRPDGGSPSTLASPSRRRIGSRSGWRDATVAVLGVASAVLAAACSGGGETRLSPAAQRGRAVYLNVCVACHNADPRQDGTIGPNLVGTSRELLEWRVTKAQYPPGYLAKRATHVMPAFPQLAGEVDDLYAFISEATKGAPGAQ